MKNLDKPGRVELVCGRCKTKFSTHSTNRTLCHKCLPKCKEIHLFKKDGVKRAKLTEEALDAAKRMESREEL